MKYLGYFVLVVVLLCLFVANFSSTKSKFECSGELTSEGVSKSSTIYIQLEKYRWWVGFWSDSDGILYLEIPNVTVKYFENLVELGPQIQIRDDQNKIEGNFSSLSKVLALSTPSGFFDGACKSTN